MQLLGCKSSGKRILHQSFLDKPVFIPGFCWEGWLDPLFTSLFFPTKGCPATSWESESKNYNLRYNSATCNTSVWLLFVFVAEISAPQLQEVRISFRADTEPCRSFMLQYSGDLEALNSSLSFPPPPVQLGAVSHFHFDKNVLWYHRYMVTQSLSFYG